MEQKNDSERGDYKEIEFEFDNTHTALFTVGTAVLMAYLKRVLMTFLSEQWRAWVFVVLNLVLLSIVFTSSSFFSDEKQELISKIDERVVRTRKKKISKPCRKVWPSEEVLESKVCQEIIDSKRSIDEEYDQSASMEDEVEDPRLSNEELNERVEAFIFMFRQHLISDAKRSGKQFV